MKSLMILIMVMLATAFAVALPTASPQETPPAYSTFNVTLERTTSEGDVLNDASLPGIYKSIEWWGVSTDFCFDNCPLHASSPPLSMSFTPTVPARMYSAYEHSRVESIDVLGFSFGCIANMEHTFTPRSGEPPVTDYFDQPVNCSIVMKGWRHDLATGDPDVVGRFEYTPSPTPNENYHNVPTAPMITVEVPHDIWGMRSIIFEPTPYVNLYEGKDDPRLHGFHALIDNVAYRVHNFTEGV